MTWMQKRNGRIMIAADGDVEVSRVVSREHQTTLVYHGE